MNFNKVMSMKMKNCVVKQSGLDGDLGRPSHRKKNQRNPSGSDENEKKDILMSNLISRFMVTRNDDNWNLCIRPACSNKAGRSDLVRPSPTIREEENFDMKQNPVGNTLAVKESTKEDIHNDEGKVQVVQDVSAAEKPADNVQFEDEREDCPIPNAESRSENQLKEINENSNDKTEEMDMNKTKLMERESELATVSEASIEEEEQIKGCGSFKDETRP